MTRVQFRLPNLHGVFQGHHRRPQNFMSPAFEEVDAAFTQWVHSLSCSPRRKKAWTAVQIPRLAAAANPWMNAAQVRVVSDYFAVCLLLEELTDTASSQESRYWADIWIELLRGKRDVVVENASEKDQAIIDLMKDLFSRILPPIGPQYRPKFVETNTALAMSMVQEAIDRERAALRDAPEPSLQAYIQERRVTIGVAPVHVLLRWGRSIQLSNEILDMHEVKEMEEAALDMFFLANDIYSYKKERIAHAAQHNAITVIMCDPSVRICADDVQGSMNVAESLIRQAMDRFARNRRQLLEQPEHFTPSERQNITMYTESLMDCVVGNMEWSLANKRYSVFESPESQATGIITFVVEDRK